ncbi:hypothetical protein SADUNF_Sadunf03G0013100 [Salix dunnii]|uniref:Patatin n=1 Tax=Salix dunnii TaxID=1413687 RepID=A0A835N353_9ROSI|nr:hypothetical protein SADUNF_Sadunf03G0013100 [Salix dunnii]
MLSPRPSHSLSFKTRYSPDNKQNDNNITYPPLPPPPQEKTSFAVATGELFLGIASRFLRSRNKNSYHNDKVSGLSLLEKSDDGNVDYEDRIGAVMEDEVEPVVIWEQRVKDIKAEKERSAVTSPGFCFSAAGLLFPYHLGVAHLLIEKGYIKETTPLAGSSAGAIVCAVIASGAGMQEALTATKVLAEDCRLRGTAFRLGAVLRDVLEKFLPDDIHVRCNGRVRASVAHNGIGIGRTEEGGSGNTNRAQTLWQVISLRICGTVVESLSMVPRHTWGELSRSDSRVVLCLDVWCIDGRFGDGAMVAVTQILWRPRGLLVDQFDSKEDLINAVVTSSFIPGYLAPRPATMFRNRLCIDGGLTLFMPPTSAAQTVRGKSVETLSVVAWLHIVLTYFSCVIIESSLDDDPFVRVCAFPASGLGLQGIGISPDCNPDNRATPRELFNWALEPAEDHILDRLFELGYLDAAVWAEENPVQNVVQDGSPLVENESSSSQ